MVKDLNGLTVKAFLGALKFNFELMLMPGFPCKPVEKHCMGMYVDGQWYHLKAWQDVYDKKDVVGAAGCIYPSGQSIESCIGNRRSADRPENFFCGWKP